MRLTLYISRYRSLQKTKGAALLFKTPTYARFSVALHCSSGHLRFYTSIIAYEKNNFQEGLVYSIRAPCS